jgi:TonB family protein
VKSEAWIAAARSIAGASGIGRPVRLLESSDSPLLVTWGFMRPTVLIPAGASAWPGERIRVVLAHELSHVRRGDWWTQLAGEILRAVHWFNPLAWIVCRRLRHDAEQACDDAVLAQGVGGAEYASHLIEIVHELRHRRSWLPAAAMASPSSLERRVSAMLNPDVKRGPVTRSVRTFTLAAAAALALAIAGLGAQSFSRLSGSVLDQFGASLSGATVRLTSTQSGAKYEVKSNAAGDFQLNGLSAGEYQMEVFFAGFATFKDTVLVNVGQTLKRDPMLHVGSLEETITVTDSEAPPRIDPPVAVNLLRSAPGCTAGTGGIIKPPTKLRDVHPQYPSALRASKAEGVVKLNALIDTAGNVAEAEPADQANDPDMQRAAIEAVRQWQYSQTFLDCQPVEVKMRVTVRFKPQG